MVNIRGKRCGHRGCTKSASYGVEGSSKGAELCFQHPKEGMVDIVN